MVYYFLNANISILQKKWYPQLTIYYHVNIHNLFVRRRYVKIHSERLLDSKAALLHNFEIKAALLHNFEINRKRYGFASFREGAHRISFLTKIYD